MNRQELRQQREQLIVSEAIALLQQQGFLDLKMAAVAKAANCSMGVIYSHFASKEDLLLACAAQQVQLKHQLLLTFELATLPVSQRLLLLPLFMYEHVRRYPEVHEVMSLACLPTVWKRASPLRVSMLNQLGQQTLELLLPEFEQWLQAHQQSIEQTQQFFCGLLGLVIGLTNLELSGFGLMTFERTARPLQILEKDHPLVLNVQRFYQGWGIACTTDLSQWQAVQTLTLQKLEAACGEIKQDCYL